MCPRCKTNENSLTLWQQMAGDLLARLRLANYKVRTGQAHIPFVQLEARSMATRRSPPVPTLQVQQPSSPPSTSQAGKPEINRRAENATVHQQTPAGRTQSTTLITEKSPETNNTEASEPPSTSQNAGSEELTLPPLLSSSSGMLTPRRHVTGNDEKLTSSVLRGGAANGLLRLAHGGES